MCSHWVLWRRQFFTLNATSLEDSRLCYSFRLRRGSLPSYFWSSQFLTILVKFYQCVIFPFYGGCPEITPATNVSVFPITGLGTFQDSPLFTVETHLCSFYSQSVSFLCMKMSWFKLRGSRCSDVMLGLVSEPAGWAHRSPPFTAAV